MSDYRAAAIKATAEIDAFGEVEGRTIYAVPLNQDLDALRHLTLGVRCGGCRKGIAWAALDANAAFVAAFQRRCPPSERVGGIWDCFGTNPWPAEGRKNWPWIEQAELGQTSVTTHDIHTPGYPLRLGFTCPKCGANYVNKNTTRLRLFLDAVTHEEDTIWLD